MGKFVIKTRKNGEYQFSLTASNGQSILASEGYSSKAACISGIESVQKNGVDDAKFERKTATNGKFYFTLKAGNGQVIGTSEMYESEAARNNGIESVKKNSADSVIDDQSA